MPHFVPIRFLANMYRAAGLTVNIMPGAETRGARLYADGFEECRGLDKHHTAQSLKMTDESSMAYMTFNAPYPVMCNVYPHKDDPYEITICAAGPTYTAGRGGPIGNIPQNAGNKYCWSWECPNNGVGEPWSKELQETMVIGAAVEAEFFSNWNGGWDGDSFSMGRIFSHFEWSPGRKIDPFGPSRYTDGRNEMWDMSLFRADVAAKHHELFAVETTPPDPDQTTPPTEDDHIMNNKLGEKTLSPRRLRDTRSHNKVGGKLSVLGYDKGHPRAGLDIILHSFRAEDRGYITCNGITILTLEPESPRDQVAVTVPLDDENTFEITVHGTKCHMIIERVADYKPVEAASPGEEEVGA